MPCPALLDSLGRPLRDLRISITDRCNFRCNYCMPKSVYDKDFRYLPQTSLLSFEEIARLAGIFSQLGVRKIRLTGGEPLLRKGVEELVSRLKAIRQPSGHNLEVTLTTNASLLARKAQALKLAGLNRLTVSLDALDDAVFRAMNDVDFPVQDVLSGIASAQASGFSRIKINMVVKRGMNEAQILPMVEHFMGSGHVLRFIEFMDVGTTNGWRMNEVMCAQDMLQLLGGRYQLQTLPPSNAGETAQRYRLLDPIRKASLEIGVIASVTQAFCSSCNRARLSTEGKLYLCLFAHQGFDLRSLLRSGASDAEILEDISQIWMQRQDRYSELRASGQAPKERRIEMSYIGG